MKWGTAFFTLFISVFVQADNNSPLIIALNEPGQLLEQRQAAVERLKKLLEQKRAGIKPTAEMLVSTPRATTIKPVAVPAKKIKIAKAVDSDTLVKAKNKVVEKKKQKVAVIAWAGALIDDHHFERLMSDQRMAQYMIKTISNNLDSVLATKNHYTHVASKGLSNSIVFDGDDNNASKRACGQYQVDKLVVVEFSRLATSGSADVTLFDCANAIRISNSFDLDTSIEDKYYLEKDFIRVLNKLYKGHVDFLS